MKELYQKRKETIERLFGTAKEYHNLRYTREKGKSKMEDKVGLTLACLNLKKLVKMRAGKPFYIVQITTIMVKRRTIRPINRKRQTSSEMFVFILKGAERLLFCELRGMTEIEGKFLEEYRKQERHTFRQIEEYAKILSKQNCK